VAWRHLADNAAREICDLGAGCFAWHGSFGGGGGGGSGGGSGGWSGSDGEEDEEEDKGGGSTVAGASAIDTAVAAPHAMVGRGGQLCKPGAESTCTARNS